MRQQQLFMETENLRVITVQARDGSKRVRALVQERDPETGKWHDIRDQVRGVVVHVGPNGVTVHIDRGSTLMLGRANCNTCGESPTREFGDLAVARGWATMHAGMRLGHEVSLEAQDARGDISALTLVQNKEPIPPKV